jgi:hypothetical protein
MVLRRQNVNINGKFNYFTGLRILSGTSFSWTGVATNPGLMVTISRHSAFCHIVNLCVTHGSHSQSPHSIDRMVFVTETNFEGSSLLVR